MQGYPNFGKVKTIVLPCDFREELTIDEYREKFGIDLREFISLGSIVKDMKFNAPNSLVLISTRSGIMEGAYNVNMLVPVTTSSFQVHNSEDQKDASLTLGGYNTEENSLYGITFKIKHTDEFKIENLKVSYKGF